MSDLSEICYVRKSIHRQLDDIFTGLQQNVVSFATDQVARLISPDVNTLFRASSETGDPVGALVQKSEVAELVTKCLERDYVNDYAARCVARAERARAIMQAFTATSVDELHAASEAHDGAQVIYGRSDDVELFYKPRGIETKRLLERIIAHDERLSKILGVPETLAVDNTNSYLEQSIFVSRHSNDRSRLVSYSDIGYMMGRFLQLGSVDLHVENLVENNAKFWCIDSETIVAPTIIRPEEYAAFFLEFNEERDDLVGHLLSRVMLFSFRAYYYQVLLNLGAINGDIPTIADELYRVRGDRICWEKRIRSFGRISVRERASITGKKSDFAKGMLASIRDRPTWVDWGGSVDFSCIRYRVVLRPSLFYGRLLDMISTLGLSDRKSRIFYLFGRLMRICPPKNGVEKSILNYEVACLADGYVPAFFSNFADVDLILGSGEIIANFFQQSAFDSAKLRIKFLLDNEDAFIQQVTSHLDDLR